MSLKTQSKLLIIESDALLSAAKRLLDYLNSATDVSCEDRDFWYGRIQVYIEKAQQDQELAAAAIAVATSPKPILIH